MARRVGGYRLLRKLGQGGMGEVHLARRSDRLFSGEVALKLIRPDRAASERTLELFLREGRLLASLRHPGIVQVYELGRDGELFFLSMEYLQGIDLERVQRRSIGPLPWRLVAYLGGQIARALGAAHGLRSHEAPDGILHGDLSPSNVMICRDASVKVLDFGLARPVGVDSSVTGIRGKLPYLPPEAMMGLPLDRRADLYAIGIILYELCTGRRLFRGRSDLVTMQLVQREPVVSPSEIVPGLPSDFEAIMMRAISRDRAARFATAEELAGSLEALVDGRFGPVELARWMSELEQAQGSFSTVTGAAPPSRSRRILASGWLVPLCGLLGLLLLSLGGWMAWPRRSSSAPPLSVRSGAGAPGVPAIVGAGPAPLAPRLVPAPPSPAAPPARSRHERTGRPRTKISPELLADPYR